MRSLISVPAGLSRITTGPFLAFSAAGSLIWSGALAIAGYLLEGGYEAVEHLLNPVSTAVVVALVGIYLWRVVTYNPEA